MKKILHRVLTRLGYKLRHIDNDLIIGKLDEARDFMRLHPGRHVLWQETFAQLALASHLRSLIRLLGPDLIIDVGANRGQFAHLLRELGYTGSILSLEPQQTLAKALIDQAEQSQGSWTVRCGAAGDAEGELMLNKYADDSFSSFHNPNQTAMKRFGEYLRPTATEMVKIRPLDQWVADAGLGHARRIFLKTDTQGHDMAVLRGASATLARSLLVMAEGAVIPLYDTVSTPADLSAFLGPLGFRSAGSYAVSFDERDLATIELDCLFTRAPQ